MNYTHPPPPRVLRYRKALRNFNLFLKIDDIVILSLISKGIIHNGTYSFNYWERRAIYRRPL